MMLYKAKNKERDPIAQKLDRKFLLASTILPLVLFGARAYLPHSNLMNAVTLVAVAAYGVLAAIYACAARGRCF